MNAKTKSSGKQHQCHLSRTWWGLLLKHGERAVLFAAQLCFGPLRAHPWPTCCSELLHERDISYRDVFLSTRSLPGNTSPPLAGGAHNTGDCTRALERTQMLLCWSTAQQWGNW